MPAPPQEFQPRGTAASAAAAAAAGSPSAKGAAAAAKGGASSGGGSGRAGVPFFWLNALCNEVRCSARATNIFYFGLSLIFVFFRNSAPQCSQRQSASCHAALPCVPAVRLAVFPTRAKPPTAHRPPSPLSPPLPPSLPPRLLLLLLPPNPTPQESLAPHITPRDRHALEYCTDVRYERGPAGMCVELHFASPNPYFENKVREARRGAARRFQCFCYRRCFTKTCLQCFCYRRCLKETFLQCFCYWGCCKRTFLQ